MAIAPQDPVVSHQIDSKGAGGEGPQPNRKPAESQGTAESSESNAMLDRSEQAQIAFITARGLGNIGGLSIRPAPHEMHARGAKPQPASEEAWVLRCLTSNDGISQAVFSQCDE